MSRVRWLAGKDGRAHCVISGRTLCHVQATAERDAWPIVRRCPACVAALAKAGR
jgi:hypothetical protein